MATTIESKNIANTQIQNQSSIEKLEKLFDGYVSTLETVSSSKELSKLIQSDFLKLCNSFITIGDTVNDNNTDKIDSESNELFLVHFVIPEVFKDIAILHRDTTLQLQIARHKLKESLISEEKVIAHFKISKKMLLGALETLKVKFKPPVKRRFAVVNKRQSVLKKIKHQKDPWEIYKEQLQMLMQQCKDIDKCDTQIAKVIASFSDISDYNQKLTQNLIASGENLKTKTSKLIGLLKNPEDIKKVPFILDEVENTITEIENPGFLQDQYTLTIAHNIKTLNQINVPVGTNGGLLLIKKIDFNKGVKKWLDYEILPLFIDVWEQISNMESYFKHSLLNLKNSLTLIQGTNSLEVLELQLQTLKGVHQTINSNSEMQHSRLTAILEKLNLDFKATHIYGHASFLEVSLQSSLTQFTTGQKNLIQGVTLWIKNLISVLSSKYNKAKTVDAHMALERSTDCIQHRMLKEENAHYDMLFLNKNFIGDLFIAPRNEQEERINGIVQQWETGFHKSVLLTGNPLCGKSTFLEQLSKKYFERHIIHLKVDSDITVEGRKFGITKNLEDALSEIKKAVYNSKPILIIDDLEVWQSDDIPLLENVRALLHFIESESDTIFILVSTTTSLKRHLDQRLRFSQTFSNPIDLNTAKIEEIYKAVMVRHGASHKKLVHEDKEPYTLKQIEYRVQALAKHFNYNIGEVLQAWTYGTTLIDAERVQYNDKSLPFFDFFTAEEAIILKQVVLYKYTSEMELKHFLGSRFSEDYQSGVRRLISTKVLLRDSSGSLYLNSVLHNDIYKILNYHGTLN